MFSFKEKPIECCNIKSKREKIALITELVEKICNDIYFIYLFNDYLSKKWLMQFWYRTEQIILNSSMLNIE